MTSTKGSIPLLVVQNSAWGNGKTGELHKHIGFTTLAGAISFEGFNSTIHLCCALLS
jgi:hypothetical protein